MLPNNRMGSLQSSKDVPWLSKQKCAVGNDVGQNGNCLLTHVRYQSSGLVACSSYVLCVYSSLYIYIFCMGVLDFFHAHRDTTQIAFCVAVSDDVVVFGELGLESTSSDFLVLLLLLLLLLVRFGILGDGIFNSGDNDPSALNSDLERLCCCCDGDISQPLMYPSDGDGRRRLLAFLDDLVDLGFDCLPSNTRLVSGVKVRVGILGAAYLLGLHDA